MLLLKISLMDRSSLPPTSGLAQWPMDPMDLGLLDKSNGSMRDIGSIEIFNLIG
ncbi:8717_t:CDS:2 [Funneliformis geosporum]|uniref:8717_t:CDS:1 n=1 Tax=Funneliformis geosporum TaxID=1117311 RepID=A0A9W4SDQ0_9GLOM|nr:8717_t:CDS:2 [Funneliformis geosporum]